MRYPDSAVVLLCTVDSIREGIVSRNPVELGCWLIMISGPVVSTIIGYLCTSIIGYDHPLIIIWVNPKVMVIAMRGVFQFKSLATIFRDSIPDIHYIDDVFILSISRDPAVVPGSRPKGSISTSQLPGFSCIITSE
jgi:hypothetical protein